MQVLPIEKEIQAKQEALHYEQVSDLIEKAQSFMVNDCICKKEKELLGNPCSKPLDVCLAMNPEPGYFDNSPWGGRIIKRKQAYEEGEEAYSIIKEKCIGCGLCISTCPSEAIELVRKQPEEILPAQPHEDAWLEERARQRGVDYSQYK